MSFMELLQWQKNLTKTIRKYKRMVVFKWLKKCPNCYSNNLQFVEGHRMFEKWFCRDCNTMHYMYRCPQCDKKNWVLTEYKSHIYHEYALGKFREHKGFYKKKNEQYILDEIEFYTKGLNAWRKKLADFNRHKAYRLKYGSVK